MARIVLHRPAEKPHLLALIQAIVSDDASEAARLIKECPDLARQSLTTGATRQSPTNFYFKEIEHYLYAGDTPLHAAAAGYRYSIARSLVQNGAHVAARNRRGAEPLHYAADGSPGSHAWNPQAQTEITVLLLDAGANPDALDKSGVAPLHRAVRQRCVGAVDSLLRHGASALQKNGNGSTPLHLAVQNTGRGGTGLPELKALQKEIIELLLKAGANPKERDARAKTAAECAQSEWIHELL